VRRFDPATDVFQFAGHQPGLLRVLPGLPAQLAGRPVIPELADVPEMERWMSFLTS
jgi:hypothetical protein